MSLTTVLWVLGGWFVLATVASLLMGRAMSQAALSDAPDAVETPLPATRPTERMVHQRKAA